jgi:repressor LexA
MVGKRLRELRKKAGLTLEALAERLGTSKQTIHRYENGTIANIPHEKIEKLAEALGVYPSEIMGWEESLSQYENLLPIKKRNLPLVGTIACGEPIYASEEYGSFVTINSDVDASFCLRAKGDSMVGARIYDGDLVFIRAQDSVDNGEIAAIIINDEATLKRVYYYPDESKIVLSPENPRYAPLVYMNEELDSIKILGKAVAFQSVIR